uniref:Putative transporter C3H1.06c n=1 Tax=Talaromyces marneffei PM1 TaxID=1077442 RepID=A0A093VRA1_TALMA
MASAESPRNESSAKRDTTRTLIETTAPADQLSKTASNRNETPNITMNDIQLAHLTSTVSGAAAAAAATTTPESAYQHAPSDADAEDGQTPRGRFRIAATMLALGLALFVAALDQTIVATIIPTVVSDLHSAAGYVWIGGAYLLANAAAANIWANMSDIWGRKLILLSATALFLGSSIICAESVDMTMMIVGRSIQGVAGAGILQMVTITISDLFSVRHRSLYFGILECIWAIAGAVGPLMGGVFTETISWRWVYWINLPVSGTAFVLLFFFLDVHNPRTPFWDGIKAVDWFGSLSILALTLMLLLGLNFGGVAFSWNSPQVICLIIFGCLMSLVFIYCEKRLAKYPLMPMNVFRKKSNIACFVVTFCQSMVYLGGEYYLPLYFQSAKGASPLRSGILVLPIVLTEAFTSAFTGVLIHQTGRFLEVIIFGTVLCVVGTGMYIDLKTDTSLVKIILYQVVTGLGTGCLFSSPIIALQVNVSQADTASATATLGFIRNMATAVSIVLGGVIFQNSMNLQKPTLRAAGLSANQTELFAGESASASVFLLDAVISDPVQRRVVRDAWSWSIRNIWILYTCVAGVGVVATRGPC